MEMEGLESQLKLQRRQDDESPEHENENDRGEKTWIVMKERSGHDESEE